MIVENVRVKSCRVDEPNDNGAYQIVFAVDDKADHKALVKMIDDEWKENGCKKKADNLAYFESEANEEFPDDDDTGSIIFIAKRNAETKKGKEMHVDVYNDAGVKYERDELPAIGKGTIANLSTDAYAWEYKKKGGCKLNFNKLQIIDLVEYSGGDTFGNVSKDKFEDGKKKKKKKKKSKK
jgi:hypothetical protein